MAKTQSIPIKIVLQLIAYHAKGDDIAFQQLAVELAKRLMVDDPELGEYILAQYELIPTWVPQ